MEISFLDGRDTDQAMSGRLKSFDDFIAALDVKLQFDEDACIVAGKLAKDHLVKHLFTFEEEVVPSLKIPISDTATSKSPMNSIGTPKYDIPDCPSSFIKGTASETTARMFRVTANLICVENLTDADLHVAIFFCFLQRIKLEQTVKRYSRLPWYVPPTLQQGRTSKRCCHSFPKIPRPVKTRKKHTRCKPCKMYIWRYLHSECLKKCST